MENVQWCVTLRSINWHQGAKKLMEVCMERAGLIRSASSPGGSPHPVLIVHAQEAAARFCLHKIPNIEVKCGDKLLVAHVGEETFDVAVQEVVLAGKSGYRMKAVAKRFGVLRGTLNVALQLDKLICAKIPCLEQLLEFPSRSNLADLNSMSILNWCSRQDSDMLFDLPAEMAALWKKFDKKHGNSRQISYNRFQLTNADMEAVFKPVLDQIRPVIADQLLTTPNVKAILVIPQSGCPDCLPVKMQNALRYPQAVVVCSTMSIFEVCWGAVVMALDEVCNMHPNWTDGKHMQTGLVCNVTDGGVRTWGLCRASEKA